MSAAVIAGHKYGKTGAKLTEIRWKSASNPTGNEKVLSFLAWLVMVA